MIDVKVINSFILIQKIKEYEKIKDRLLSLIEKMPNTLVDSNMENINKSDYYLPKEHTREYGDLFLDIIKPYNYNIKNFYRAKEIWIKNYWYQQYNNNDYHNWHVHSGSLLSSVFYIELQNKNSTIFYDHLTQQEYSYNVEEGDLITFPSMIPHKSEKNSKDRKTIISFNADFNYINIPE